MQLVQKQKQSFAGAPQSFAPALEFFLKSCSQSLQSYWKRDFRYFPMNFTKYLTLIRLGFVRVFYSVGVVGDDDDDDDDDELFLWYGWPTKSV